MWIYKSGARNYADGANMWHSDASRPAYAEQHYTITAPVGGCTLRLYVQSAGDLSPWPAMREASIIVDGTPTTLTADNTTGVLATTATLAAGGHTVVLRDGAKAYDDNGTRVDRMTCSTPLTKVAPTAPQRRLVVLGDSISTGFLCTHPTTDAWAMIIRDAGTWAVTCHSGGGWSLGTYGSTAPDIAALVALLTPCFDGTVANVLWISLGYNDANAQVPAATWGTWYANLIDAFHAALPHVQVYCQSPITATVETFGAVTLTQYRSQVNTICSTRYPWAIEVNGATAITAGLSGDGVHPDTAGNATYATSVEGLLPWDPYQETGVAGYLGTATDIYGARNITWDTAATLVASDAGYGGQPTLNMAGNAYGHTAGFVQAQPSTVVFVGNTDGSGNAAISDDVAAFRLLSSLPSGGSPPDNLGFFEGTGWVSGASTDLSAKFAAVFINNGAGSDIYYNASAAAYATGNPGANGIANGLLLGKRHDQLYYNNGKIAAHIEFTGAANAAKVAKIMTWAAFRFGGTWT